MLRDSRCQALQVVPTICFAFVCHMNVFPIYQELKDRSIPRMDRGTCCTRAMVSVLVTSC